MISRANDFLRTTGMADLSNVIVIFVVMSVEWIL